MGHDLEPYASEEYEQEGSSGEKLSDRSRLTALLLGLPLGIYRELIRRHRAGGLDFSRVVTFNLDEYYPMARDSLQGYRRYMWENLFEHVNVPPEQVHIPDGSTPRERLTEHCAAYERAIRDAGGLDFQLLGIGKSGHIGVNEPGSPSDSRTRPVHLDTITRKDAAADFFGEDNVPREAITMGVKAGLDARTMIDVINVSTGRNSATVDKFPKAILPRTFDYGGPLTIGLKDLERARNARRRDLRVGIAERADLVERLLAVHAEPAAAAESDDRSRSRSRMRAPMSRSPRDRKPNWKR